MAEVVLAGCFLAVEFYIKFNLRALTVIINILIEKLKKKV